MTHLWIRSNRKLAVGLAADKLLHLEALRPNRQLEVDLRAGTGRFIVELSEAHSARTLNLGTLSPESGPPAWRLAMPWRNEPDAGVAHLRPLGSVAGNC